jgi:hypothetical protein
MAIRAIVWTKDVTPTNPWSPPTVTGVQTIPGFFLTYEDLVLTANDYFHTNTKIFSKTIIWEKS